MPEISEERLKELEQAEEKKNELLETNNELKEENEELQETKEELESTIKEKDEVIAEKNDQIVGVRKKYSEMNEEEKEKLSEQERQLAQRQEELEEEQKRIEQEAKEQAKKERESRKKRAFRNMVGDDEEAIEKMEYHFDRIKDSDEAQTMEEIEEVAQDAYNMMGEDAPDPINQATTNRKTGSGQSKGDDFSETPEGKTLQQKMGIGGEEQDSNPQPTQPESKNPLDNA